MSASTRVRAQGPQRPTRYLVREPLGDSAFVMVAMPLTVIAAIVVGLVLRAWLGLDVTAVG